MTNAMLYTDKILDDVRMTLAAIKERGGKVSTGFLNARYDLLQGSYPEIVLSIACMAIGKTQPYPVKISDAQLGSLVERAKKQNGDLVVEIAQQRAK